MRTLKTALNTSGLSGKKIKSAKKFIDDLFERQKISILNRNEGIKMEIVVQQEVLERKIYIIRGHKVMLDSDLAELYQVPRKG